MFIGNDGCGCCESFRCRRITFNNYHRVFEPGIRIDSMYGPWGDGNNKREFNRKWFWDNSPWWQSFTGTSVRTLDDIVMGKQGYHSSYPEDDWYRTPPITTTDENGNVWWNFAFDQTLELATRRVDPNLTRVGSEGKAKKSLKFSIGLGKHSFLRGMPAIRKTDKVDPRFTDVTFIKTIILDSKTGVILYEDNGRTIETSPEDIDGVVGKNSTIYYDIVIPADYEIPEKLDILYWTPLPDRSDFVDEELEQEMANMYVEVEKKAIDIAKKYPEEWNWITDVIGVGYGSFYCVFFEEGTLGFMEGAMNPIHPFIGNTATGEGSINGVSYAVDNGWIEAEGWKDGLWDWEQYENGYLPPLRRFFLDYYLPLYDEALKKLEEAINNFGVGSSEWVQATAEVTKYEDVLEYGDQAYQADSILAIKIIFQINQWQNYINFGVVRQALLVPVKLFANDNQKEQSSQKYTWVFPDYGRGRNYQFDNAWSIDYSRPFTNADGELVPKSLDVSKSFSMNCIRLCEAGWSSMDYFRPEKMRRNKKFFTRASGSDIKLDIKGVSYNRFIQENIRKVDSLLSSESSGTTIDSTILDLYLSSPRYNYYGNVRFSSVLVNPYWRGFYSNKFIENLDVDTSFKVSVYNIVNKADGTQDLVRTHFYEGDTTNEDLYDPFDRYNRIDYNFDIEISSNVDASDVSNTGEFIIEIECGEDADIATTLKCPLFGCVDMALNNYRQIKDNYNKIIKIFPLDDPIWETPEYVENLNNVTYGNAYTYVPTDRRNFYTSVDGDGDIKDYVARPWSDLGPVYDNTLEEKGIRPVPWNHPVDGYTTTIKDGIREILVELESEDYSCEVEWGYQLWKCTVRYPNKDAFGRYLEDDFTTEVIDFVTPLGWKFEKFYSNTDFQEECRNNDPFNPDPIPLAQGVPIGRGGICDDPGGNISINFEKVDEIKKKTTYKFPGSKYNGTFSLKMREGNNKVFEYVFDDIQNDCQLSVGQISELYTFDEPEDNPQPYGDPSIPRFNQQSRIYVYSDVDYDCAVWGLFNGFTTIGDGDSAEDGSYNFDWDNLNSSQPTTVALSLAKSEPLYQPHAGIKSIFVPVGRKNLKYQNTAMPVSDYSATGRQPSYHDNLTLEPRVSGWIESIFRERDNENSYYKDYYTLRDYYTFQQDVYDQQRIPTFTFYDELFFFGTTTKNQEYFDYEAGPQNVYGQLDLNLILGFNIKNRINLYNYPHEGGRYYNILTNNSFYVKTPLLLERGMKNPYTNYKDFYNQYSANTGYSRPLGDSSLTEYEIWMRTPAGTSNVSVGDTLLGDPYKYVRYWKEYARMDYLYKAVKGDDTTIGGMPTRNRFLFECSPGEKNPYISPKVISDKIGMFPESRAVDWNGPSSGVKVVPLDISAIDYNDFPDGTKAKYLAYRREYYTDITPWAIPFFAILYQGDSYINYWLKQSESGANQQAYWANDLEYSLFKKNPELSNSIFAARMGSWLRSIGGRVPVTHHSDYMDFYDKSIKEQGELKIVVKSVKVILDSGEVIG